MKLALFAAALLPIMAHAVTPWELPWMNHATAGTIYKSAAHANGVFVVEAYFLGCHYCNENAQNVNDLTEKYVGEPRVQVLDVGIDRNDSQYATWIQNHRPNHPVLKDAQRKLIGQLGTTGYPSTYVIDAAGKVVYRTSGVWNAEKRRQIMQAVDGLLKQ